MSDHRERARKLLGGFSCLCVHTPALLAKNCELCLTDAFAAVEADALERAAQVADTYQLEAITSSTDLPEPFGSKWEERSIAAGNLAIDIRALKAKP